MMFRNLAVSLVGIFAPVYFYKLGYGIPTIFMFFAVFFTARIVWDFIGGYLVARVGPKHAMIAAYILQIIAFAMLTSIERVSWPPSLIAVFWGGANSIFFVAFHTDFSKIKHKDHGGKELGWLNIMERVGLMLGPVVGGAIATWVHPSATFGASVAMYIFALIPLFFTGEAVSTHQKLHFSGLKFSQVKSDLLSYCAISIENNLCINMWPLYVAVFIFTSNTYLQLGVVSTIGVLLAMLAAMTIGKIIDEKRGRTLLRVAATCNAVLHLIRPLLTSFGGVLALNTLNEITTVGYRMPYTKGMYDAADEYPGYRIVYIVFMEAFASVAKAFAYWMLFLLSMVVMYKSLFFIVFIVGFVASFGIMLERFKALKP